MHRRRLVGVRVERDRRRRWKLEVGSGVTHGPLDLCLGKDRRREGRAGESVHWWLVKVCRPPADVLMS